uniref:Uncharacterized protein n=1 Tax=Rhizophagus irregularis (strain DAOM 181602 / DAOM 197198 / MUCL 43194) TaxID=747089 RepID=U9THA6_RHIID
MHQTLIKIISIEEEGYYSSLNLVDFDIPTKYEELEYIIRISHIMLQVKKLLLTTISQFKHIKKRVKKEKLTFRKVILHNKMKEYRSLQSTETEGL